jgi:PAS domain S-box-containing protein
MEVTMANEKTTSREQQHLALLVERSPLAVIEWNPDFEVVSWNPAAETIFGFSQDEALGRHAAGLIVPAEVKEIVDQVWADLLKQTGGTRSTNDNITKDGRAITCDWHNIPLVDDVGTVLGVASMVEDITDRKEAEKTILASQQRLSMLVDQSPLAVIEWNPDFEVVSWNPAAESIFGFTNDEAMGRHAAGLIVPEAAKEIVDQVWADLLQQKGGTRSTNDNTTKDQRTITCEWYNTPIVDVAGNVFGVSSLVQDITERVQAEQAVIMSQQRLALIIEQSPLAVIEWNLDFEVASWNPAAEQIFGYPSAEALGKHAAGLIVPEEIRPIVDQVWQDLLSQEGGARSTNENFTKDGHTIVCEWYNTPLIDPDGKIIGVVSIVDDITVQKAAAQELTDSETRYRSLYEYSPDGFLLMEGNQFVDCNPAAIKMLSVESKADVLALQPFEISPEYQPNGRLSSEQQEINLQQVAQQGFAQFEWAHIDVDGNQFLVEVTLTPFDLGDRQFVSVTWRDIAERKRLETEVQAAFERRGYQVRVGNEIAQEISRATELSDLFERVVTVTKDELGYYHTQLLRYEPGLDAVVLITGYGETGRQMFADGHRLPMGAGLIGTAAATGETVLRPDLAEDPDWQPNPLLPETRGEIAIPIKLGDVVLGVLDIQSDTAGGLTDDDRLLLEGICGQIAIAMDQTRLRQEMDERLLELNSLHRTMTREGWQAYRQSTHLPDGFVYDQIAVRPLEPTGLADELFSNAPLTLRGEILGEIAIADDLENPVSEEDKAFLGQISEQVALALESARLFEQTQSALSEVQLSEERVRTIVENAPEAIVVVDVETGMFVDPNKNALKLYGYDEEGILKVGPAQTSPVEQPNGRPSSEMAMEFIGAALQGETPVFEWVHCNSAGEEIDCEIRLVRLPDPTGQLVRASVVDIRERKAAEAAIQEAQERFELAVAGSNDGVWDWDVITNEVYYSPRLKAMVGYSDEEFGNDFAEFEEKIHPDDHDEVMGAVGQYLEGKISAYEPEFRFRHKDGSYRWILSRGTAIRNEDGVPFRMAGSHTDVTERRLQEEANARRASELATVAEVGTTVSGIMDPSEMLQTVVDLSKDRFELYHAHIYMVDESGTSLELASGAGEVGRQMVSDGWQIPMDAEQSLVAQAARDRQGVVVNDVQETPGFLANPLLPDTRAEMAVPLIAGDQVLGVLDIQSDAVGAFIDEDVSIQTTLASQIAVALQNAHTYASTQKQAEHEALINVISQRIQSTTSVENALQVAIREIGRALGAKRTSVKLDVSQR